MKIEKAVPDVVLIGAGIMSATLGILLKELEPAIKIDIYERLDTAAAESSDAWNNAGTGHSAFCELNYTPQHEDGSIDISKAIAIAESFEVSRQFWAYLVKEKNLSAPSGFISSIPHMSLVWGDNDVDYLKKRYEALQSSPLFHGMEYTEDHETLKQWMPLIMQGREASQHLAATKMDVGTDVNFGSLTRAIFKQLTQSEGINLYFNHEVKNLEKENSGWKITVKDIAKNETNEITAGFVFLGAGGGALPLLLKSGIKEGKGFGGFPVSGQWLKCNNRDVIEKHDAKVYGKAAVGSPPMSVPHLDTRMIKGKKELLFGPYAGFTTKFLKQGSFLDLPKSVRFSNIVPMIAAGLHNIPLTKYLVQQVRQSPEDRLEALRTFFPDAKMEDWQLEMAGQRVQVIKKDEEEGGILEFGTEVISAEDGSLAALLGASPGASTAVAIMVSLLGKCFPEKLHSAEWQRKLKKMIPSYGLSLSKNPSLCRELRAQTAQVLGLAEVEV